MIPGMDEKPSEFTVVYRTDDGQVARRKFRHDEYHVTEKDSGSLSLLARDGSGSPTNLVAKFSPSAWIRVEYKTELALGALPEDPTGGDW